MNIPQMVQWTWGVVCAKCGCQPPSWLGQPCFPIIYLSATVLWRPTSLPLPAPSPSIIIIFEFKMYINVFDALFIFPIKKSHVWFCYCLLKIHTTLIVQTDADHVQIMVEI